MSHEIECPSGLCGILRGMRVKDEQLFTNKKLVRSGAVITHLLNECWEQTTDPGPYVIEDTAARVNWNRMLAADRTHALIQLRIISYGEMYPFNLTCQYCSHHFGWQVNLEKDFESKPVSPEAVEWVRSGVPVELSEKIDGHTIKCRPLIGEDERELNQLSAQDGVLVRHLAQRVVSIDEFTHRSDIIKVVSELPTREADKLWDITDEMEGGVDTAFDVECPGCESLLRMTLPFGAGFFSSRKRYAGSMRSNG